jgi:hypothetical protein
MAVRIPHRKDNIPAPAMKPECLHNFFIKIRKVGDGVIGSGLLLLSPLLPCILTENNSNLVKPAMIKYPDLKFKNNLYTKDVEKLI